MIPILYKKDETNFNHNGIGKLKEASKCLVTEERNGVYEVELQYPISGKFFKDIVEDAYIVCNPAQGKGSQRFRIYKVNTPKNGFLTAYASHVSYQLNYIPIKSFEANGISAVLSGLKSSSAITNPFSFQTDIASSSYWAMSNPKDCRSCLKGSEGSIVDVFGGELEFDNYTVKILKSRGKQSGIVLSYGNNITDIVKDMDISSLITGLLPYVVKDDVITYGDVVYSSLPTPFPKVIPEDVSSSFDSDTVPTKAQITSAGRVALNNHVLKSVENLRVSFVPTWESEESKERMQNLYLCDTVRVRYEILDIDREMKVIKTVYNALLDRYDSIELGEPKQVLTTIIKKETQRLSDDINQVSEYVDETAYNIRQEMSSQEETIRQEFRAADGVLESSIEQVQGDVTTKYSKLTQDINGISSEVGALEKDLDNAEASLTQAWSSITQTASEVSSKVGKDNVISSINQTSESVKINASKISLTGVTSLYSADEYNECRWERNQLEFYAGGARIGRINVADGFLNLYSDTYDLRIGGVGQRINVLGSEFKFNDKKVVTE